MATTNDLFGRACQNKRDIRDCREAKRLFTSDKSSEDQKTDALRTLTNVAARTEDFLLLAAIERFFNSIGISFGVADNEDQAREWAQTAPAGMAMCLIRERQTPGSDGSPPAAV